MVHQELQLLVHGENISELNVLISGEVLKLVEVHRVENPNYLFLDLELVPEKMEEGSEFVDLIFQVQREVVHSYRYELKERKPGSMMRNGFDNSDAIYLLMPDRFSNGNPDNDDMPGMVEKADRSNGDGRHGGDIQGIMDKIDYLNELGITALWINPLLENNMPAYSYHGYAITDYYLVDPRYGTNEQYISLVNQCHKKDLKVIMDMVFNHCGSNHWFIKDIPMKDWIHQFPEYTSSNYRGETVMDPYASGRDKTKMLTGWFDRSMPDLNQHNEFLANYLIQNSIWWIEYADLDGIRMDTYPYSYKDFMKRWVTRIKSEYPNFSVLGEVWLQKESHTSYFQQDSLNRDRSNTNLSITTDFPMHYALAKAFNENDNWTKGIARIYYVLSQDFLYSNPMNTVVFADNHDLSRYFTFVHEDLDKWKMGMAAVATLRGIPMIYYGTEILMTGEESSGHGYIREDFQGGWKGDTVNLFTTEGRSDEQEIAFNYLSTLMNWRKESEVIHTGNLMQFIPDDGTYVYFRYNDSNAVMVVFNNNKEKEKQIVPANYREMTENYRNTYDIFNMETHGVADTINVLPKSVRIFELK